MRLFRKKPPKKSKCVLMYCECREYPEHRELIHQRDAYGIEKGLESRGREQLLDLELEYLLGHVPMTHDEYREEKASIIEYYAEKWKIDLS